LLSIKTVSLKGNIIPVIIGYMAYTNDDDVRKDMLKNMDLWRLMRVVLCKKSARYIIMLISLIKLLL
jgi:hypothetical protein